MHFTITVPNPLARLTGILVALERGRGSGDPRPLDRPGAGFRRGEASAGEDPPFDDDGMDGLGLICSGTPHGRRDDDLEFLSLSDPEGTSQRHHDSLSGLSLSRNPSPRSCL